MRALISADTHVHVYPFFDRKLAIESACKNLTVQNPGKVPLARAIFLTERSGATFFDEVCSSKFFANYARRLYGSLPIVRLTLSDTNNLYIISGKQIVTSERLEVLALCTQERFSDDLTLFDTIERITASGAQAILPWSFGKWSGRRKQLIEHAMNRFKGGIAFGDIPSRTFFFSCRDLFEQAKSLGLSIISGSDPLPLRGEEARIGSFRSEQEIEFDPESPLSGFNRFLHSSPRTVGIRETSLELVYRQMRLRTSGKAT